MRATDFFPDHFRVLDPPAGGLERLRMRIAKPVYRRSTRPLIAFASLVCAVILLTSLWITFESARQEQRMIAELESIFASARLLPLTIDGREPVILDLGRDDLLAFWVKDEH